VVAAVATQCAECHRATRGGPALEGDVSGYHPSTTGLREAMARHVWAAEELWLGMTAPRHEAWIRGAKALAEMPLPGDPPAPDAEGEPASEDGAGVAATPAAPADAASEPGMDAGAEAQATGNTGIWGELEAIRALGVRAEDAAQPAQKAAVYAEILTACAQCHARTRGPRP
jgi:cytochrome c2